METKHTPGPWNVSECRTGPNSDRIAICHGDENEPSPIIAEVHSDYGKLPRHDNARLIAAAPETAAERDRLKELNYRSHIMTPAEGVLLRVSVLPCDRISGVEYGGNCTCLGCDARRGLKDFAEVVKSRDDLLKSCKALLADIAAHINVPVEEMIGHIYGEANRNIANAEKKS